MNEQERTVSLAYGDIALKCWGNPSHPVIFALHGWLDSAASFDHLAPELTKYYVIAPDLPGHGRSAHRPEGIYFHMIDYLGEIIDILDKLELSQVILLGHSLGGALACLLTALFPERFTHLLCIDALGPFAVTSSQTPDLIRKSILEYQHLAAKRLPCYPTPAEAMAARLRATPMAQESVACLIARNLAKTPAGYRWRNDPRLILTPMVMLTEEQIVAFLERITIPTCLIKPSQGWRPAEDLFEKRIQAVSDITTYLMTGQHHVHLDKPKEVAELLTTFLHTR